MLVAALRAAARITTGSTYAILGLDAARSPGPRVGMAAPTLAAIRNIVPLPVSDEMIVRSNGALQAAAGVILVSGYAKRPAAIALIASLIPTTMAGHAFWKLEDPLPRKMQTVQFQKNVAMLGGLLFALCE